MIAANYFTGKGITALSDRINKYRESKKYTFDVEQPAPASTAVLQHTGSPLHQAKKVVNDDVFSKHREERDHNMEVQLP